MASLVIFTAITLGIVPLLAVAMKGVATSRNDSIAENAAKVAMERLRGLRYYVSYDAKPKRVDLLDLYFPQTAGTLLPGQSYDASASNPPISGTGGVFSTVCPPTSGTNPACPPDLPEGYTVTFRASFVKAVTTTTPQSYSVVTPPGDYSWNAQGKDTPPAKLLDVSTTVGWSVAGSNKSFRLRSIVGERTFSPVTAVDAGPSPAPTPTPSPTAPSTAPAKLRGSAEIAYTYQIGTGFSSSTAQPTTGCVVAPCKSEFLSTIGSGRSEVRTQTLSTAITEVGYADMRLVRTYPPGVAPPDPPPGDLAAISGVVSGAAAPPTSTPPNKTYPAAPYTDTYLTHPDFANAQIAKMPNSYAYSVKADVSNELPIAQSGFASIWTSSVIEEWYHNNQSDFTTSYLRLLDGDYANKLIATQNESIFNAYPNNVGGYTQVVTGALGTTGRRVESVARAEINYLKLLRFHYTNQVSSYIVWIQDFIATARCKSTANGGTAISEVTWSASIIYYRDTTADNKVNPTAQLLTTTTNPYSSSNPQADPSAAIGAGPNKTNYLVYDVSGTASDLWLFNDPAQNRKGYLESWSLNTSPVASRSADGRTTSGTLEAAIRINTAPMSPTVPETAYTISVGKLSCESVDNR